MRKNLSKINDYTLAQIIGINNFKRDDLYRDIEIANGYSYDEPILPLLLIINRRGNYNKNLLDYINNIIMVYDYDIDIEEIDEWSDEDFELFKDITHKDFWNFRLKMFYNGFIKIQEKPKIKNNEINWGYSDISINKYLNNIPTVLANKAYKLFENKFEEVTSLIWCETNDIYSINNYKDLIFSEGNLFNDLFNLKEESLGRAEALMAFVFEDSKIMGISDNFDLKLKNDIKIEIKAPNGHSFRFGTKGSVGNYKFFTNILETRKVLKQLMFQMGSNFKKNVSKDFYLLSTLLLKEGNFKIENALSTAIDSAEISSSRLNLIGLWFFMAHIETYNYNENNENGLVQDIFTNEYLNRYEVDRNRNELINVLKSLEYVKNPFKLRQDIDEEIKECFKGIDYLICFNIKLKEINIYTSADDIIIDSISQNGIKVIERKYKNNIDTFKEDAFEIWQKNKDKNYYNIYSNLKFGIKEPKKMLIEC